LEEEELSSEEEEEPTRNPQLAHLCPFLLVRLIS